jgi:hypothetical protein|tara:strand:+ start:440 stop:727 length:288 start_codon:yes stop_codon:yes gene_type:complete
MTEEQMDKLAEIVAVKVMDKLIAKQKEWDKQFEEQIKNPEYFEGIIPAISEKAKLEMKIKELKLLRNSYIINEEYELLSDVEAELIKLEKELYDR